MAPPREPHDIDPLLDAYPVSKAPDTLWDRVQDELARPEPVRRMIISGRPILSRVVAAAAIVLPSGETASVTISRRSIWYFSNSSPLSRSQNRNTP